MLQDCVSWMFHILIRYMYSMLNWNSIVSLEAFIAVMFQVEVSCVVTSSGISYHNTKHVSLYASFEAFMAVMFQVEIFWVVVPCSVVVRYQCFRGSCCLFLQGPLKCQYPTATLHNITTQKTLTWNSITFTSNISKYLTLWCQLFS